MKNKFIEWSKNKYSKKQRFIALIPEIIFFLIIIPILLFLLPFYIDIWFNISRIIFEPVNLIIAILFAIIGFIFALWTIFVQFTLGKGTPAPMMPTQKLVKTGPYIYCRNPMYFGALILYLGVVILTGSISSFGIFAIRTFLIIIYIKYIEEKELELRFGKDYIDYKKNTPFFIPLIWKKRIN